MERLREFPLFKNAPESFLAAIGSHLKLQLYSPQETILAEDAEAKAMYFLLRGRVAVVSRDLESEYAELHPGQFFGEIGILLDMSRKCLVCLITNHHKCLASFL